jgi:acyl-CoA reductase-like NAD-dependent aldehyde dehydrogenase/nicotinamidase-related amidase
MKPLLVLVDLQCDYLSSAAIEPAAGTVVERAARLLSWCRERPMPVAHVWTTVTRQPDNRMPHWKQAGRWCCEAGTPGHEPPSPLAPRAGEAVIHKTFFSGFTSSHFPDLVRDSGVDTLIVAGIHLHACVRQTVLDAYQSGLAVWVAEDAVGSDDPIHAAITRRYLEARGVRFVSIAALTTFLQQPHAVPVDHGRLSLLRTAIDTARYFQGSWRKTTPEARAMLAQQLAERIAANASQLAELMARELGKPVRFGRVEGQRTADKIHSVVTRSLAMPDAEAVGPALLRRRPHGVVAAITPYNNPIYLALGKIVPAVLYGNTVVWKPAPAARLLSRRLFELLEESGWPTGLVNLLEGSRREAEDLMNDAGVAAVTLTGSSAAGRSAQDICARRCIPLQAELGGNNAAIVWPDANLIEAAGRIAAGAFEMAGQRCTANRRVIVHASCREPVLELLLEKSAALHWGDPLLAETQIGPLVSASHRDRVAGMVERASAGPALLPLGSSAPDAHGHAGAWYPPTIVCCDDPDQEIVREETFGPVLVVQAARDWDHAIGLCNGVCQGLAAAVFTGSRDIVERFLDEAQAGILKVNQSTADAAVDVPFGGWKTSGVGTPEHGIFDVEFYTRPQTVYGTRPEAQ